MTRLNQMTAIAAVALVTLLAAGAPTTADASGKRSVSKQISIMEKIIDEAMVESKNALVQSTHPTHGAYLEGYGPIFTLEVGLVDAHWFSDSWWSHLGNDFSIITEEDDDGDKVITIKTGKGKDREKKADDEEELDDAAKYALVKEELIEVIRDYGDTIAKAKEDDWFTLFASPLDSGWGDDEYQRLVLRVKMKHITAFNNSKLDEKGFRNKVEITEY